jgi:hypothetical protein
MIGRHAFNPDRDVWSQPWLDGRGRLGKADTIFPRGPSRREPAAANCSNKSTTLRWWMRLLAAGQARTTLNEAFSATLQAGGWEAATRERFLLRESLARGP